MTELSDGISITGLTIGGAALTALGGMIGAIIRARMSRTEITPQPLEVRGAPEYALEDKNKDDHINIFSRLSEHDKDIARLKEANIAAKDTMNRIEQNAKETMSRIENRVDTALTSFSKGGR